VASRLREGDLEKIRMFSVIPLDSVCSTLLARTVDCVEAYSGFVDAGDRDW
jgi:itaconate CoA-transferase